MCPSSTSNSDTASVGYRDDELIPLSTGVWNSRPRQLLGLATLVLFFVVVIGGTILDAGLPRPAPRVVGREGERLRSLRDRAAFLDGTAALQFETSFRTRSTLRHALMPAWSAFLWRYLDELDAGTLVGGSDGWLFQVQRLTAKDLPVESMVQAPAALLAAVSRRLAARGCQLVVVPVPRKEEIYSEALRKPPSSLRPELYGLLVDALRNRGVRTVDLATPMRTRKSEGLYFKTDSHWSDAGVRLAAEVTAQAIDSWVPEPARTSLLVPGPKYPMAGDLLKMGGILRPDGTGPSFVRETVNSLVVLDRETGRTRTTVSSPTPGEFVMVGTSYSYNSYKFPAFLRHYTNLDGYIAAWPALGPIEPFARAMTAIGESPYPRTLVWEIPTYEIFCVDPTLPGLNSAIQKLGGVPTLPLLGASDFASELSSNRSSLLPGTHHVTATPLTSYLPEGRLIQPGSGVIEMRLTGRLRGGRLRVGVATENGHSLAIWDPEKPRVDVPVLGHAEGRKIHISVKALDGAVDLDLEQIEFSLLGRSLLMVKEEANSRNANQLPWPTAQSLPQNALVAFNIARLPKENYPIEVQSLGPEDVSISTTTIPSGYSPHTIVHDLAKYAGQTSTGVRIRSAKPLPPGALQSAVLIAP